MKTALAEKLQKLTYEHWFNFTVISICSVAVYVHIISFSLTGCDDKLLLNQAKSEITGQGKQNIFVTPYLFENGLFYRPVINLSFYLVMKLGGESLFSQFCFSIFLHLISCLLIYILLEKTGNSRLPALVLSIIFSVHPVFVNAVAWLPGRNDTMLTVFFLLSFICMLNFWERKKTVYIILHYFFFLLALFTKETAVIGPVVFLIYILLFLKNTERSKIYKTAAGWILCIILWYFVRSNIIAAGASFNFWGNQLYYIQALGKIIIPVNLTVLPVIKDTSFIYGIISGVILAVLFYFTEKKDYKKFFFGIGWFVIFLFPTVININIDFTQDVMVESRLYLSAIGILISLSQTDFVKKFSIKNTFLTGFYMLLIAVFAVQNFEYAETYRDDYSFWQDAADNSPSLDLAFSGLGLINIQHENYEMAVVNYKQAAELNPTKAGYNGKIAYSLLKLNKVDESEKYFRNEIKINHSDYDANLLLGIILYKRKAFDESEKVLRKAESINKNDFQPSFYLMKLYYEAGMLHKAKEYAEILKSKGVKIPEDISRDLK